MTLTGPPASPYASGASPDAVLLLSFGGPERGEDVMPFLENVTRGRGIPPERLEAVAVHYHELGGRSPINDQNRALLAALRRELDARGRDDLPLYWGNRNWAPYLVDALRQAHADGARRLLVLLTSAYSSYSGCRQYREDLAGALERLAADGLRLEVAKVRACFDHPGFVAPQVDAVVTALEELPAAVRDGARLVFVTHSLPVVMNDTSGPQGGAYLAQHRAVAEAVRTGVQHRVGHPVEGDLVFCSRSGPPGQPWLEPDVEDHLTALSAAGAPGVVLVPIGFISDHMEVRYDLDTAAARRAADLGLPCARAATVGTDPRFVAALVDLVTEAAAGGVAACPVGCCPNPRGARPAAAGADRWGPPPAPEPAPDQDPAQEPGAATSGSR